MQANLNVGGAFLLAAAHSVHSMVFQARPRRLKEDSEGRMSEMMTSCAGRAEAWANRKGGRILPSSPSSALHFLIHSTAQLLLCWS